MLSDSHPYLIAREGFLAGLMHTTQAIGMVASDRDFRAEAELRGWNVVEAAREVVLERWLPKLVEEVAHGNAG